MAKKVLTDNLSQPLNGATNMKFDISTNSGNLAVDGQTGGEPVLASGTLQYMENQSVPSRTMAMINSRATFTVKSIDAGQRWLRFPWQACNGATEWHIHLNPGVASDISARSGGGNVDLDLSGMRITGVLAETGGGNMDIVLPDSAANAGRLSVTAKSGAGNVSLSLPGGVAARIRATSGMGKVIVDPRFVQVDKTTYQSPDYDSAAGKIDIELKSGAGNVTVKERAAQAVSIAR